MHLGKNRRMMRKSVGMFCREKKSIHNSSRPGTIFLLHRFGRTYIDGWLFVENLQKMQRCYKSVSQPTPSREKSLSCYCTAASHHTTPHHRNPAPPAACCFLASKFNSLFTYSKTSIWEPAVTKKVVAPHAENETGYVLYKRIFHRFGRNRRLAV